MSDTLYAPVVPLDLGVGKDTLYDFGVKYNHEIEHIYDILNEITSPIEKISFTTESGWGQQEDGSYRLVLSTEKKIPLGAYKNGTLKTKNEKAVVSFNVSDAKIVITCLKPFNGYILTVDMEANASSDINDETEIVPPLYSVYFYDFDGSELAKYSLEEALTLDIDDVPYGVHEGLTFTGWNYALNAISTETNRLNISAKYDVDNNADHLFITIPSNDFAFTIGIEGGNLSDVAIDWGDETTGDASQPTHTYALAGNYKIVIKNNGNSNAAFISGSGSHGPYITKMYLGDPKILLSSNAFNGSTVSSIMVHRKVSFTQHTNWGSSYFASCNNLTYCNVTPNMSAAPNIFSNCANISHFSFDPDVSKISNNFISSGSSLLEIILPNTITSIDSGAFYYCTELLEAELPSNLASIGDSAFEGCSKILKIDFNNSFVKNIGQKVFKDCSSLKKLYLPPLLEVIQTSSLNSGVYSSFNGCSSLEKLTIPASVTRIGSRAFFNSGIKEITFEAGSNLRTIEYNAFAYTPLKRIDIPNSVTSLGDEVFSTNLEYATIGTGLTTIGNTFANCTKLKEVTIASENLTVLRGFSGCSSLRRITVPSSVETIGSSCFSGCSSFTTFTYNGEGLNVESNAFNGCGLLNYLPDILYLGESAFRGCASLKTFNIDDCNASIPKYCFANCTTLKEVTVPDSVVSVEEGAFSGCISLTTCVLPDDVYKIGDDAFSGCQSLLDFDIPDSVQIIGGGAFSSSGITNIYIPTNITSIGKSAFYNCSRIVDVEFGDGLTVISSSCFRDCQNLGHVHLPDTLVTLGEGVFYASKMQFITIPAGVTAIQEGSNARGTKTDVGGGTQIYMKPSNPPIITCDVNYYFPAATVVYIPTGSLQTYSQMKYWSVYASKYVEMDAANMPY